MSSCHKKVTRNALASAKFLVAVQLAASSSAGLDSTATATAPQRRLQIAGANPIRLNFSAPISDGYQ